MPITTQINRKPGRREFIAATLAAGAASSLSGTAPAENTEKWFYRAADPDFSIVDSMKESLRFTTRRCLTTYNGNLCANSTFVNPEGIPQPWHEFGELEGVGWAANAVGGAYELLWFARLFGDRRLQAIGVSVLYHALEGGFFQDDGFLRPYRDISTDNRYLNYLHQDQYDNWFCPGSSAYIALQLLWASDEVDGNLRGRLRETALQLADWLWKHVGRCENGWYPRRVQPDGSPYPFHASQTKPDPQFDCSGDGAFLIWLWTELTRRGERDCLSEVRRAVDVFQEIGGAFGSINHDTYDNRENVAYSVGFRALIRAASLLRDDSLFEWALAHCLHGLEYFEIKEDRNGVATQGLLFMEDSWDTCYLWENAEAAMAYLEAAVRTNRRDYELKGLTILRTAALHHHGPHGFLTEGVDWNNHNGQWRKLGDEKIPIHVGGAVYGDVNYTQPFLNNMHIAGPTLFYLERLARKRKTDAGVMRMDCEENDLGAMYDE